LVALRADASILTGRLIICERTPSRRITAIVRAEITVITFDLRRPLATPARAGIARSTGIAIATGRHIIGMHTSSRCIARIVGTDVAVVAELCVTRNTASGLTNIALSTHVFVIT